MTSSLRNGIVIGISALLVILVFIFFILPRVVSAPPEEAINGTSSGNSASTVSTEFLAPFSSEKLGTVDRDITYCTIDGVNLGMDIHWPESGEGPFPVVVYVHGGGWNAGDKGEERPLGGYLGDILPRGIAVIAVNYRLAQEYTFPAMIEDVKCAVRSIRANAEQYHIDPDRIAALGGSAGGHLVSLLGVTDASAGFDDVGQYQDVSSRVVAVANMYGPTDLTVPNAGTTSQSIQNTFGTSNYDDMGFASPITYITSEDPAFLLIHGEKDTVVPIAQSESFAKALEEAGIEVEFIRVANAAHSFSKATKNVATDPTIPEITVIVAEWLESHLK
ncbi:MAG: alpha/beta hydrolase [Patescibacteria group bacterium]